MQLQKQNHTMKETITKFYEAFKNKDAESMVALYHEEVIFSDPAFGILHGNRAKNMWRMLIENGKDLEVNFEVISADEKKAKAHWQAKYTFSKTGRRVVNEVDAYFLFKDGLIIKHVDDFNRKEWAKQAMGLKGRLFGGTGFFRDQLYKNTKVLLDKFEAKNNG